MQMIKRKAKEQRARSENAKTGTSPGPENDIASLGSQLNENSGKVNPAIIGSNVPITDSHNNQNPNIGNNENTGKRTSLENGIQMAQKSMFLTNENAIASRDSIISLGNDMRSSVVMTSSLAPNKKIKKIVGP